MVKGTTNALDHVAPARVLLACWLLLLVLLLAFATDAARWAEGAESAMVRAGAKPAARALLAVSSVVGLAEARERAVNAVTQFYEAQARSGARYQALATAAAAEPAVQPPATPAVNEGATDSAAAGAVAMAETQFRPSRVLLIGDSSIQAGLGTQIERRLEEYDGVSVLRFGQHSTGLARPDYFDWWEKLRELKQEFEPDLVIAYWGDNDCQGLSTREGGLVAQFGNDEWDEEYGRRVIDIVELMREGGGGAVIVGMPIMRSKSFSRRIARLNGVAEAATIAAGGVYLPTWEMTSDEEGEYVSSVEFEGKLRIIRAGDGIHLSTHGSAYVADGICRMLEEHFELTPGDVEAAE